MRILRKPWNPYVFRQTVVTEYLGRGALTKHQGDQFFGWSQRGNTAVHYQNYFGDEAADSLGAYFGVAQRQPPKVPKERQCPNVNCQELNSRGTLLCQMSHTSKCCWASREGRGDYRVEGSDDADFRVISWISKKRMNQMDDSIRFLTDQITKYREQFGPRPLKEKEILISL